MNHSGVKSVVNRAWLWAGGIYRSAVLKKSRFVVVTGSCGKTTTKELTAAVLGVRHRVFRSPEGGNLPYHFCRYFYRIRPEHELCVLEVAGADHDQLPDLDGFMRTVRPSVSVVTAVGLDHFTIFRDREAVAAQKGKVIDALTEDGIAVLNADDDYVIGMRTRSKGRVVTFGLSADAMVRGADIRADWPDRLSLTATCGSESVRVQTQLCGPHFAADVLAALAVGHALGVPLADAAEAVGRVAPYARRMCPAEMPDGVTFICDNEKAPMWTLPLTFDFLRAARAKRKVLVLGTISDYGGNVTRRARQTGVQAMAVADVLVTVGPLSTFYMAATPPKSTTVLKAFANSGAALEFLYTFLEPGDLVMVKGSELADHLSIIAERWNQKPARTHSRIEPANSASEETQNRLQIIVGLGNPNPEHALSPHNVGQQAVDAFASHFGAAWREDRNVWLADVMVNDEPVRLVKLRSWMNESGPALAALMDRMKLSPEQCILVFDDVSMPPGQLRQRESGSAGGHKGVESILLRLETQKIRRLKIGVGRPPDGNIVRFVTRPFADEHIPLIAEACQRSIDSLRLLLEKRPKPAVRV